ncbi:Dps family protein [Cohnella caldifontis]|uniref:Dps family protein n=1 Tax=Cohnella caldifontis TaxID=3027471 RepID=UPI0023EC286F|nr:DNA starvation/stationary phase protection protein [Cohnella sp. YIM B05605]
MSVKEPDLAGPAARNLEKPLNVQLSNWAVAYIKLHHCHWFVKGPEFQSLHAKFEELYDWAAEKLDELAERMLAIGLRPASTLKEYMSLAEIRESGDPSESATKMLEGAASDFGTMAKGLKAAAETAERNGDSATADVLNGQIEELEKQIWMLKATLSK